MVRQAVLEAGANFEDVCFDAKKLPDLLHFLSACFLVVRTSSKQVQPLVHRGSANHVGNSPFNFVPWIDPSAHAFVHHLRASWTVHLIPCKVNRSRHLCPFVVELCGTASIIHRPMSRDSPWFGRLWHVDNAVGSENSA